MLGKLLPFFVFHKVMFLTRQEFCITQDKNFVSNKTRILYQTRQDFCFAHLSMTNPGGFEKIHEKLVLFMFCQLIDKKIM